MGCIYRRGRRYTIKYHRDGRQFFESTGSDNYEEAKRLLRLREGDIAKGVPVTPKIGRMKFDEAFDDWLNDQKIKNRRATKKLESRLRLHLVPHFAGRRMSSISTADVNRYIAKRMDEAVVVRKARRAFDRSLRRVVEIPEERRPVANATINRELAALKRMFVLAMQAGKLTQRPHIPMLAEDNVRTGFFEREQYEAVLAKLPEELRPVVTFAYVTGWRVNSEILTLQWRNVDLKAGEIRLDVGTTKNKRGRFLPLNDELRALLEQRYAAHKALKAKGVIAPWVFFRMVANGRRGEKQPRPIRTFDKAWKAASVAAGCPGRIKHDFRRTACRNFVRSGVPETVAMRITGHVTRSVFDRYNIVSDGDLRDAMRRLDPRPDDATVEMY